VAQEEALPAFACHVPLMSLPLVFGTTLETVPAIAAFGRSFGCGETKRTETVRVGLAWAGSPTHMGDRLRSLALRDFVPLRGMAGVDFVSLQVGTAAAQARGADSAFALAEPCAEARDFADTADVIAGLDLVISVDTAVAHLAGSLGKPVDSAVASTGVAVGADGGDDAVVSDGAVVPEGGQRELGRSHGTGCGGARGIRGAAGGAQRGLARSNRRHGIVAVHLPQVLP
jgi:hypothetical protein